MKFAPFSFSKIHLFEQCPLKFKYNYIDKLGIFEPNLAMERGLAIHDFLENHVKNKKTDFKFRIATQEEQEECLDIFINFKKSDLGMKYLEVPGEAEVEFGMKILDGILACCSYYDSDALFRGKIDLMIMNITTINSIDYKTGKVSGFPQPLQLVMYAVYLFNKYPNVDVVRTCFVYVEHTNEEKVYEFHRSHLNALTKKVLEKIVNMENEEDFNKKISKLCEFCEFKKNGVCSGDYDDNYFDKFNPQKPTNRKSLH